MLAYDLVNTIVLVGILALILVAYSFRLALKGRAQFDRVDKQGGSVLLGKGLMEMAYWALQPVARFLVYIKVTPNQLSWASLVLGGMAGTALAYGYFGFGALFSTYSAFLDTLDGMVARMTDVASDAGEVLDAAVDRYVEFFFLAGLVLYYQPIPAFQVIALCALCGSFMISYSTAKAEALQIPPPPGIMRRPERAFYLTLGAALSPIPMPWLDAVFTLPMSNPGYPLIAACFVVAVLANISAIERLWTIGKLMREKELAAEENLEAEDSVPHLEH
ncbi:CDP-alcohol phosphatidyltransferase family protein [bacterium]|nr:CDP-alcohol phosphatidyltransferase family protein [bacterium]NBX83891.1 CDP-alcohol phosphatidyltransferase family protein [bacterium]